jgi:hypothetical protein
MTIGPVIILLFSLLLLWFLAMLFIPRKNRQVGVKKVIRSKTFISAVISAGMIAFSFYYSIHLVNPLSNSIFRQIADLLFSSLMILPWSFGFYEGNGMAFLVIFLEFLIIVLIIRAIIPDCSSR